MPNIHTPQIAMARFIFIFVNLFAFTTVMTSQRRNMYLYTTLALTRALQFQIGQYLGIFDIRYYKHMCTMSDSYRYIVFQNIPLWHN